RERVDGEETAPREIADALQLGGNVGDASDAFPHAPAFVVAKNKGAVADDRRAQRSSELIALVLRRGLRGGSEEIPCVQRAVAEEFVRSPVNLVGAGFQHRI